MENTPKAHKSKGSGALRGICILLYLVGVATSAWTQDCDTVRIYFDTDQSRIDTAMADNAAQLKHLRQTLNKIRLDTLTILSSTSPDGGEKHNSALARQRTRSLINHINKLCPTPSRHYKEKDIITRWDVITDRIRTDDSLPDKEHVIGLLASPQATALEKQKLLKGFERGIPYRYIARKYFPPLRYSLCILPRTLRTESYPAIGIQAVEPSVTMKPQPLDTILPAPAAGRPARWRISTNLLYWATVMPDFKSYTFVPNLELEWFINNRWSLAGEGSFANWRYRDNRWFGISSWSVEPRWWLNGDGRFRWLYIGAYGQVGDYDVQDNETDWNGNTGKLWGLGLSAGVAIPFSKHFGLEVGIRAGYRHSKVKSYTYEEPDYFLDMKGTDNHWGVTGIKASIYYRFGKSAK